ncbi:hypothetical protein ACF0H5_009772 [Mactra antiquata]
MNGFRVTGIHPLNNDTFEDIDFVPCTVTDRPAPENDKVSAECIVTDSSVNKVGESLNHSSPWKDVDNYFEAIENKVVPVVSDGHCLLHAIRTSPAAKHIMDISHDALCATLVQEAQEHSAFKMCTE